VSRRIPIAALVLAAAAAASLLLATCGGHAPAHVARRARACTTTLTPALSATAIAGAIASARDGANVCLAGGSYPPLHILDAVHRSYVTVEPASAATVTVAGIEVSDSAYLRFQGLHMSEGFNMRDAATSGASHDFQLIDNTFEEPLYGVVLYGGAVPIKDVLIEGNYMHRVHLLRPEVHGRCFAGYAQGQDVTIFYAEGVTIARNTFNEAAWHYLQGGSAGPEGVDVEHNLFEGRVTLACSHLNLWQIWNGGEDDTFKDNTALGVGVGANGERPQEAATDGLIFENGPAAASCATSMRDTVITNNLFVDAASSYELQIYTTQGVTIEHNTVVGSQYGSGLLQARCGPSSDAVMTHNIDVENTRASPAFDFQCAGSCVFNYNVSDDASAGLFGAAHARTDWTPSWGSSSWDRRTEVAPAPGFYVASGLPFAAGYEGGGGP
jgi:hypothetical protein